VAIVTKIPHDQPIRSDGGNHVEITPAGGKFIANGSVAYVGPPRMVCFNPPAFDSLAEAIAQSVAWADQHNIADVYVREAANAPRA
jgi:hypothetical protein